MRSSGASGMLKHAALLFLARRWLYAGLVCAASPLAAQVVLTPMPFGQSHSVLTPLPFGQRSNSPLRPLTATASALTTVAQWNMDETSGTTMIDSSGNGNNGTMYNIILSPDGYVFDGTTSKVVVPVSPTLNPEASDFSYSARIQTDKIPPAGGDYDVIRHGAASTIGGGYRLEIENSNGIAKAYCSMSDNSGLTLSVRGKTNVADGVLHVLTCTKTSAGITLQVDGLAPITKPGSLGTISNAKPLIIGVKSPTGNSVSDDWYVGTIRSATISIAR